MYSYDHIVRGVLHGMILNMLERGFTEEEAVTVLQSKQVRHVLDGEGEQLVGLGWKLAGHFTREG